MVQWLRFFTANTGSADSMPSQGTNPTCLTAQPENIYFKNEDYGQRNKIAYKRTERFLISHIINKI